MFDDLQGNIAGSRYFKSLEEGHIISLIMKMAGAEWNEAMSFLKGKAVAYPAAKIQKELPLEYELQYNKILEAQDISEEIVRLYEIGVPKGKTMLSGCVAFTCRYLYKEWR